ncbi:MAG: hypothetical protein NZ518_05740 [Dehalococcoidia bacterium]|nr:hypothetical protein [Dehalococcoidia bacterium]
MVIEARAVEPSQVTITVPVPGRVAVPMTQDHDATPAALARWVTNPCATLFVPAGVKYVIEQVAPGRV